MPMRRKYPRTLHFPFSPGICSDDKVLKSFDHFFGKRVVITQKFDGENTTLYRDGSHARSVDSAHHVSRDWVKRFQAEIGYKIPAGFRVCGENLYAVHSLAYNALRSYFYGFSIWEHDVCLSWDETQLWFEDLGIVCVPYVVHRGAPVEPACFDLDQLLEITNEFDTTTQEGFVVRMADAFKYDQFSVSAAKWVRPNHVQTTEHWMSQPIRPNRLACQPE